MKWQIFFLLLKSNVCGVFSYFDLRWKTWWFTVGEGNWNVSLKLESNADAHARERWGNQMMTSENRRECNELACQSPFTTVIEVNPCIFRPGNMHSKSQWTSKWVRWTRFKGEQTSAVLRYIHMSLHKLKKPMMKRLTQHTVNLKRSQGSKTSWSSFF